MHKYTELNRFLSCEEIVKKEMCAVDDVKKILESTTVIWNH